MPIRTFLKVKIFFLTSLLLLILTGCEDNTTTEPPEQNFPDYYPSGIGSTFKYSVTEKDSAGNLIQSGTTFPVIRELYDKDAPGIALPSGN